MVRSRPRRRVVATHRRTTPAQATPWRAASRASRFEVRPEDLSGFLNAEASEEPQLDDTHPPRIDLRQAHKSIVERAERVRALESTVGI